MSENPSLYHLGEELDRAIDRFLELGDDIVDTETGEVVDALAAEQTIADAAANFEAKLEACALKALNLEAQATVTKGEEQAFKKEYERLRDLRKLREARADRLKRYVAREMKRAETKKFEGERVELGVRETKAVDAPKEIPNLAKLARGPLVTKETVYKLNKDAVKGAWDERVEALAARLNVDVDTLREINRIPKGMRLKAGSTVMIPRTERHDQDISASLVDTAMLVVEPDVPDAKRVVVKAGRKDTVATVARRYGVSTRQVQSWNKLSGSKLVAGQSLVLMLRPNSAAAARAERGDDGDDAPAHSAKGRGKAQASTKATKSEAADKSAKVEKSGKAGKAEPRKRVVVEATPHKAAAKAAPVKAASTAKTKTTHAR